MTETPDGQKQIDIYIQKKARQATAKGLADGVFGRGYATGGYVARDGSAEPVKARTPAQASQFDPAPDPVADD